MMLNRVALLLLCSVMALPYFAYGDPYRLYVQQHPKMVKVADKIYAVKVDCPPAYYVIDGACLRVYKSIHGTISAQRMFCQSRNPPADIATIDSTIKNEWVTKQLRANDFPRGTIGAKTDGKKHVSWYSNKAFGFVPASYANFNGTPPANALHIAVRAIGGKWEVVDQSQFGYIHHAVVCEYNLTYPVHTRNFKDEKLNYCPTNIAELKEYEYTLVQGTCIKVVKSFPQWSGRYFKHIHKENGRTYHSASTICPNEGMIAVLDSPEKNMFVKGKLAEPIPAHSAVIKLPGWVSCKKSQISWEPNLFDNNYTNWEPTKKPTSINCAALNPDTGYWNNLPCGDDKFEAYPVCQRKIYPVCFELLAIENAKEIKVVKAHRQLKVTCMDGYKRVGPQTINCRNRRHGPKYDHVACVRDATLSAPDHGTFQCRHNTDLYLAFPPNVSPYASAPSFYYANKTCRNAYMAAPSGSDYACLVDYLTSSKFQFPGLFGRTTGVWMFSPSVVEKFRWVSSDRNSRGFSDPKATQSYNHLICVGRKEFPANPEGRGQIFTFRGLTFHFPKVAIPGYPNGVTPNSNMGDFARANLTCTTANMTVPDIHALAGLKALVKHTSSNRVFKDLVSKKHGLWIHINNGSRSPYQWMDSDGHIQGYADPKWRHHNNHVVCMTGRGTPAGSGGSDQGSDKSGSDSGASSSSTVVIGGATAGGVLGLCVIGFFVLRARQVRAANTSAGRVGAASAARKKPDRRISQTELVSSQSTDRRTSDHSLGGRIEEGRSNGPSKYYYNR